MNGQDLKQLTLFPEDSPANLFPWLESKKVKKMTVTCGRRCSGLSENLSRVGYLVRTYLESCELPLTTFARTWSVKATASQYLILKLRLSERCTDGNESSSLLNPETKMWPTPKATMRGDCPSERERRSPDLHAAVKLWPTPRASKITGYASPGYSPTLEQAVIKLWPTPTSRDYKDGSAESCKNVPVNSLLGRAVHMYATPMASDYRTGQTSRWENPKRSRNLNDQCGGQLNPDWVEWLMGFPEGWTDLEKQQINREIKAGHWKIEPDIPRTAKGIKDRVGRLKGLGNAVVPQQAYPIFKAIREIEEQDHGKKMCSMQ